MHRTCLAVTSSALALMALAGTTLAQNTEIVSLASNPSLATGGALGNLSSGSGYITPNGRWMVFNSIASNLVTGDANSRQDVFVRDLWTNTTVRVNVPDPSQAATEANDASSVVTGGQRVMSDNGRFIIFSSSATNLIANDTNGVEDVFIRDRDADGNGIFDEAGAGRTRTRRVSLSSNEAPGNGPCPNDICDHFSQNGVISANGRYIAWQSQYGFTADPTAFTNVYWRDRDADNDGNFDESGGSPDAAVTKLVSKRISGQFVGQTGDGTSSNPSISADGRWVAFQSLSQFMVFSDSVGNQEIFVRDMFTDTFNVRVSEPIGGGQPDGSNSNPSISGNGRFIAFVSSANNLAPCNTSAANIIVKDRDSDANGAFDQAGHVAFDNASRTFNPFVLPDGVVFLNDSSSSPSVSDDGRYVAFASTATNFACSLFGCADQNAQQDVFVFDRTSERLTRASVRAGGDEILSPSIQPTISSNGRFVTFASDGLGGAVRYAAARALLPLPNTVCAAATEISGAQTIFSDNYAGPGDLTLSDCNPAKGNSAWYRFVASCTGQMIINTAGSSFDTVLSVHPDACGSQAIACNDDVNLSAGDLTSQLVVSVVAGQAYRIRVAGFGTNSGRFVLGIGACQQVCVADYNGDGVLDPDDLSDYIACYFSQPPCDRADWNGDSFTDPDDLSDYISAYFGGCN